MGPGDKRRDNPGERRRRLIPKSVIAGRVPAIHRTADAEASGWVLRRHMPAAAAERAEEWVPATSAGMTLVLGQQRADGLSAFLHEGICKPFASAGRAKPSSSHRATCVNRL